VWLGRELKRHGVAADQLQRQMLHGCRVRFQHLCLRFLSQKALGWGRGRRVASQLSWGV
jgi:hypothetical protein